MSRLKAVQDWGGFEKFVAHIHDDGEVTVEHDKTLTGKSGATRQIDVVVKVQKGPYEYLTLIECKFWNSPVKREQIDVLWASMQDLNAAKGVFFTTKGFQKGAQKYAESKGIDLYRVRELTDDEWGRPGRVVDLYLQIVQRTIGDVIPVVDGIAAINGATLPPPNSPLPIQISLGSGSGVCKVASEHRNKFSTVEAMIDHHSLEAQKGYLSSPPLINSGEECTRYFMQPVNLTFATPLVIEQNSLLYKISSISLNVGLKVLQSRLTIDRGEKLFYALAVVDCIKNKTFAVSRGLDQAKATWSLLANRNAPGNMKNDLSEDTVANGSIIAVSVNGYFDPHEMDTLTPVDWRKDEDA